VGNTGNLGARMLAFGAAVVCVLATWSQSAPAADIGVTGPVSNETLDGLAWQEFVSVDSSEDWQTADNWSNNRLPEPLDNAAVRYGGPAQLTADAVVRNLIVDNSGTVFTNGHRLGVTETAMIEAGTIDIAGPLGVLDVDNLRVNSGGGVYLKGGSLDANMMTITAGGTLFGYGQVDVATELVNDGRIWVVAENLTLATVGGQFDLDGTGGNGEVVVEWADLTITGPLAGDFNGTMTVGYRSPGYQWAWGRKVTLSERWVLGEGGTVNLLGQPTVPSVIDGGLMVVAGQITVDGVGEIVPAVMFTPTARVSLPDVDDELILGGSTIYMGGTFTGNGTLSQNGPATIQAYTTIATGIYDWDGQAGDYAYTTISSTTLTINASQIEHSPALTSFALFSPGRPASDAGSASGGPTRRTTAGPGWPVRGQRPRRRGLGPPHAP